MLRGHSVYGNRSDQVVIGGIFLPGSACLRGAVLPTDQIIAQKWRYSTMCVVRRGRLISPKIRGKTCKKRRTSKHIQTDSSGPWLQCHSKNISFSTCSSKQLFKTPDTTRARLDLFPTFRLPDPHLPCPGPTVSHHRTPSVFHGDATRRASAPTPRSPNASARAPCYSRRR